MLQRRVDDNIAYRAAEREHAALQASIAALEAELGTSERTTLKARLREAQTELDGLRAEMAHAQGRLSQQQEEFKRNEQTLRRPPHSTIENEYREQLVKVTTSEVAATDLEMYTKAIDSAIMRFHSLKMAEVNKIMHELWTATYTGADIDAIEIKSNRFVSLIFLFERVLFMLPFWSRSAKSRPVLRPPSI